MKRTGYVRLKLTAVLILITLIILGFIRYSLVGRNSSKHHLKQLMVSLFKWDFNNDGMLRIDGQ